MWGFRSSANPSHSEHGIQRINVRSSFLIFNDDRRYVLTHFTLVFFYTILTSVVSKL